MVGGGAEEERKASRFCVFTGGQQVVRTTIEGSQPFLALWPDLWGRKAGPSRTA